MRISKRRPSLKSAFLFALLVGLLFAGGCVGIQQAGNGGGTQQGGGTTIVPAAAAVSICDSANSKCQATNATYSLETATDLNVGVDWSNVPAGNHSQEMRLLMPNGNVYQRFQNSFVVPASDSKGNASVSHFVPIIGTFIAERQIAGDWKLEISLDGKIVAVSDLQFNP